MLKGKKEKMAPCYGSERGFRMEGMGGNKDMMLLLSLVVHEVRRARGTAQNRDQCLLKIDGSTRPPTIKKWPLEVLLLREAGVVGGGTRKKET